MSKDEIKALITIHINELEKELEQSKEQKKRIIEALKETVIIVEEANHIPRID